MSFDAPLSSRRCQHHHEREAVARCPSCSKFFCRECVTEHDDRVLCKACLKLILEERSRVSNRLKRPLIGLWFLISFMIIWTLFFKAGQMLLAVPSSFHEGTIWKGNS